MRDAGCTYKYIDIGNLVGCCVFAVTRPCVLNGIETKNRLNLRKHDVRFETAVLVFDDPYAITRRDRGFDGEELRARAAITAEDRTHSGVHVGKKREEDDAFRAAIVEGPFRLQQGAKNAIT
jgi:uncharacterized DUF497 family protein